MKLSRWNCDDDGIVAAFLASAWHLKISFRFEEISIKLHGFLHGCFQKYGKTPKSSILIGFSIINHPFWGFPPYFWETPTQLNRKDSLCVLPSLQNNFPSPGHASWKRAGVRVHSRLVENNLPHIAAGFCSCLFLYFWLTPVCKSAVESVSFWIWVWFKWVFPNLGVFTPKMDRKYNGKPYWTNG